MKKINQNQKENSVNKLEDKIKEYFKKWQKTGEGRTNEIMAHDIAKILEEDKYVKTSKFIFTEREYSVLMRYKKILDLFFKNHPELLNYVTDGKEIKVER